MKRPRRHTIAFLIFLLSAAARPSARAGEYRAPLMDRPPTLDGRIEPQEWAGAVRVDGFAGNGVLERRMARAWAGATETRLYFAIRSQLPAEGQILADVRRDTENLVFDDSVEVWIDPAPGGESGRRFQMLANSLGHRWYKLHAYGGAPDDPAWRGDWQVANGFHDGVWDCEIAIPIAQIAPGRKADEGAWGVNLCRNWKQEWAWSSLGGGEYRPTERFVFTKDPAPVVRCEQRGDLFTGNVETVLSLFNPSSAPIMAQAQLLLQRDVMPEIHERQTFRLAPGETKELILKAADATTKKYALTARVTSEDGQAVFFDRKVAWAAAGPWRWTVAKKVIPPLDFQFAYYPYSNRMRILADTSNLPKGAKLATLTATIRKKAGAAVKAVRFGALKDGKQEIAFSLPPLKGEYEIAMQATGPGVPVAEVVKTFERTVFPWEHNTLGKSAKVYPPFTPIRVKGKRVSVVLRDHEMNDAGLWNQVIAKGRPLLAAPMRWEVMAHGRTVSVRGGAFNFRQIAGNRVETRNRFFAGPLTGDVTCAWDYDGLMRVEPTIWTSGKQAVDSLTLIIPLRADQATHYHAMGDGIRNTLYARVPPGEGTVWTAKQAQASDLPPNFCAYLYVGTPVRGLCWFAENDKGWGWDPATPNVELARRKGVVEMRVHLINRPEVLTKPRTLTFGLMAAPVKPRLSADWRHKYRRDNYQLLGTDINWLALGDCGSVYPAGCDMYLWQMIARGNKEHLSEADIQKVIERGKPYFEPYGAERVQAFINHARYNLTSHYGGKMIFYYNRASFQAAPEFETFKDEWDMTDYRTVGKGSGIGEIKIVPSESYIDHALWWYGKSFDIGGNKGVYWDNWFFAGTYNTEMTGAYRRDDGTVVPSTGLWGLRELCKRTFQYMNERKMPPITMPHMTSTGILPLLSFATVQYDWEWKYSEGDVQTRFPRDYILMVTNGELAGTWPVLLNDHGPQAEDPWTARTFAAVAMLHELDCPYPAWSRAGQQQLALFKPVDEILQQPGVQAYRYWDDRPQPVRADDPDLPAIAYSVKGREAVFAVVSYADGDRTANLTVDAQALGFPNGCRVTDTETGQEIPMEGNRLSFPLKKHDVRVCRVTTR
jgi:hypothetical protein